MRVKVAGHSGFCFGVKRAIKIAEKTLEDLKNRNIYSLGPIIHNPQVVDELSRKGLRVVKDINNIKNGAIIISSHGAPIQTIQRIKQKRLTLIDATCPFVKNAHDIVRDLKAKGYRIIIVGDKKHPEVKALLSLAGTAAGKVERGRIGIVSQTTQSSVDYIQDIAHILRNGFSEARIFNTICKDTSRRQNLAREFLKECDVMVVVGGKNSANTRRLWQICKESGVDSYHIETPDELKNSYFRGKKCAGIISGASTPDEMVKKVVQKLKQI